MIIGKRHFRRKFRGETEPSYSCGAQLALHGNHALYPVNAYPEGKYITIPPGRVIHVYDVDATCETFNNMQAIRGCHTGDTAAYATLTIGSDGKRQKAVVNVDGTPIGRLSIHMSNDFVPLVEGELAGHDAVVVELHFNSGQSCFLNVMRPFEIGLSSLSHADRINHHEQFATIDKIDLKQYPDRFIHKVWSESEGRYIRV